MSDPSRRLEPPPQPGARCQGCRRALNPDYSSYRDPISGAAYCLHCVDELVEEKLGLVYVPKLQRRGS